MSLDLDRIPRWAPGPQARVNWSHPLARGLVAIGCGTMQWSDRHPRQPTAYPSTRRTPIATPFGPGLGDRTADNDGYYTVATVATPTSMTLMAVVNCTAASPDDSGAITWGNNENGLLLGVGAANAAGPNIYVLDRFVAHRTTSAAIAQTGWRTIAVSTASGVASGMTIYRDGVLVSTQSGTHATAGSEAPTIRIGAESSTGRCFDGQIAAWGAWDRLLDASEHVALYHDPFQMLTED